MFATKYTQKTISVDDTETIYGTGETGRVYGFVLSCATSNNRANWEFYDSDDNLIMEGSVSQIVGTPENIDMSFLVDKGLKVKNVGAGVLDITVFHSQIGT